MKPHGAIGCSMVQLISVWCNMVHYVAITALACATQGRTLETLPLPCPTMLMGNGMAEEAAVYRTTLWIAALLLTAAVEPAKADNAACWGDPNRMDISCTSLTQQFIMGMRAASRAEVLKAMNAPGRHDGERALHYIGVAVRGWGGDITFTFGADDRVVIIEAFVDGPNLTPSNVEFLWNADGFLCSNFPGSRNQC
jgi:hypothetical protein